jgi:hypothetical protein
VALEEEHASLQFHSWPSLLDLLHPQRNTSSPAPARDTTAMALPEGSFSFLFFFPLRATNAERKEKSASEK